MKRWKIQTSAQCPWCTEPNETKHHIFQCQANESKQQWELALQGLDNWLQAQNTHPGIWQDIITGLWQWQTGTANTAKLMTEAVQEQSLLGWDMMMEGVISRKWQEMQAIYWKVHKSQKSSKWWMVALIKKLLQIAWDMWHHWNHALHHSTDNHAIILEHDTSQQLQAIYDKGLGSFP